MYRMIVKNNEFTLPKENLIMLARFQSGFSVEIESDQDAIDYFKSIGLEVSEVE